jgi:hypothetical protein
MVNNRAGEIVRALLLIAIAFSITACSDDPPAPNPPQPTSPALTTTTPQSELPNGTAQAQQPVSTPTPPPLYTGDPTDPQPPPTQVVTTTRYFTETAHYVRGEFLAFYNATPRAGEIVGLPLTEEFPQQFTDGTILRVQYFERARLEVHGDGNTVVQGRVGALLRNPQPPAQPNPNARFFPETGHNLGGAFRAFWEVNGGLATFGFPITEELVERNPGDGKEYIVQYFERARFEYHPEAAGTPAEVQLGALGRQLYDRLYGGR